MIHLDFDSRFRPRLRQATIVAACGTLMLIASCGHGDDLKSSDPDVVADQRAAALVAQLRSCSWFTEPEAPFSATAPSPPRH
jgi:hypothetical protein